MKTFTDGGGGWGGGGYIAFVINYVEDVCSCKESTQKKLLK